MRSTLRRSLLLGVLLVLFGAGPGLAGVTLYGAYWDTADLGASAGAGISFRTDNEGFAWELRGTYFPDLTEDFDKIFDSDTDSGFDLEIEAIPLDLGVVVQFFGDTGFRPYVGGGVSYFLLDSNVGNLSDEVGYYGVAGLQLGSGRTLSFALEAVYRVMEGTLETDVDDFGDLFGNDIQDEVDLDLAGIGFHAGVVLQF